MSIKCPNCLGKGYVFYEEWGIRQPRKCPGCHGEKTMDVKS